MSSRGKIVVQELVLQLAATFYELLLTLFKLCFDTSLPIVEHTLPQRIVGVSFTLGELLRIKMLVETQCVIFRGNLLDQHLPIVASFDYAPLRSLS